MIEDTNISQPKLLILNQMAGPMTWELAEDAGCELGCVAVLTGHPDTLAKGSTGQVQLHKAVPYQRGSFVRRALSWLHYSWQAFWWLWRWPTEIPVLLFSNPPILCWVGWLLKMLRGQRYSVMVHDIYPDVLVRIVGFSEKHPLIRLWYALNQRAYENAEVVMTLGEYMAANLEKQFDSGKTRPSKVEVIYPWVDTEKIKPIPKTENWFAQKYNQVDKLTVMYSGNMGLGHDIETMLAAAKELQNEEKIHFMFIGAGPKWDLIAETIEKENLKNVTLLPWQHEDQLPFQLATADIGLVSLEPELWDLAIPSKALYMMAAGCAIFALAPQPSALGAIIEGTSAGTVLPVGEKQKLTKQLISVIRMPSTLTTMQYLARQGAISHYSRKENSRIFMSICTF